MIVSYRWLSRCSYLFLLLRPSLAAATESAPPPRLPPLSAPRSVSSRPALPAASPPTVFGLRLPAFIAFGVAGMSTGGAVATRLAATSSLTTSDCGSKCSDVRVARKETLVTTSRLLAGVAAAGIGTGLVFLLCAPPERERTGLVPTLRVKVTAQRADAGATWKF